MKTSEIAALSGVHPNTVHLYESWGFISPVPRLENGYRKFSLVHALQMKLARLAFRQEFIQNNLRKRATEIVVKSGQEQFAEALKLAKQYLDYLSAELAFTHKTVEMVKALIHDKGSEEIENQRQQLYFTHAQAAKQLQLSEETLRNWERNGLYSVKRNAQNRRLYHENDMRKLYIIRTLRSAHFSISSIRQFLVETHKISSVDDIKAALNMKQLKHDFFYVTDALEENLNKAIADIQTVIALLQYYIKGELSLASLSRIS